jgi:hypothetical protein
LRLPRDLADTELVALFGATDPRIAREFKDFTTGMKRRFMLEE